MPKSCNTCEYFRQSITHEPCVKCIDKPIKSEWKFKGANFQLGDKVEKTSGSSWFGIIVGTYSTKLTPEGYCVESTAHPGSVQIYPAKALRKVK